MVLAVAAGNAMRVLGVILDSRIAKKAARSLALAALSASCTCAVEG